MSKILEEELLKSAIEIGGEIIDKAIIDSNGIHWKTVKSITSRGDLEADVDETISTGVSGIVLFYIELYKANNSEIYLNHINSSANWLINHCQKKTATHGFYSGRMGAVFTLLKIAEVTRQEYYHSKAIEIALQFKNIATVPIQSYNLYNGLAGSILGLLCLHAEIKENWILDSIYEGIEELVKTIKSNSVGFYWDAPFGDNRNMGVRPLCGLPFGSNGIGLLFLHLGKYFNNKDYEYIGIQALNYEDQYYNEDLINWTDFRINTDYKNLKKLRKSYLKGDRSLFKSKNYCANWMFGVVGHSFARLRAHDILKDKYSDNIIKAIENNLKLNNNEHQLSNYTLATGKGGLGLLLLTHFQSKSNKTFLENALAIAQRGINERATKGFYQFGFSVEKEYEDDSLFMGNAGIGYFYLKLLSKDHDCILLPTLNSTSNTNGDHMVYRFSINYAIDKIAGSWFANTLSIIGNKSPLNTSSFNHQMLKTSLISHIEQSVKDLQDPQADDAYKYDKTKLDVWDIITDNYGHFRFVQTTEVSKNVNLLENNSREGLMAKTLQLNQYSYFLTSKWDWKNVSLNDVQENAKKTSTLFSLGEEYKLSEIQFVILNSFKIPQKVSNIYRGFIAVNDSNAMDQDYLLHLFIDTIRNFMSKGVLVSVKKPVFGYFFSKPKILQEDFQININDAK